jgi:acyl-CoA thioesterase FadM
MSGILTRWLVLQEHTVTPDDLGSEQAGPPAGDATISDETVERWVAAARTEYLSRCEALEQARARSGLQLAYGTATLPRGAWLGRPTSVVVTASASEVRPASFTISVRLRPFGGDRETAVNATCVVRLEDPATGGTHPLARQVRDELIALEHSATHFN